MAMLPSPLIPDARQWIDAYDNGFNRGETIRKRNVLLEAGQLAAAGGGQQPVQPMAQPSQGAQAQAQSLGGRIRMAESGGRLDARNPNSSAFGPDQFIARTWLDVLKRHRPDLTAGKSDAELLSLRSNDELSGQMRDAYTMENQNALRSSGLPVTDGTSYLSYFAGAGGARKALRADPSTPVAQVLSPDAIRANPFLQNMTAGDLRSWADRKAGSGGPAPAAQPSHAGMADPNAGLRNASNALLRGGEFQAGLGIQNQLYERSEKARAEAAGKEKERWNTIGEFALRADTPEKWARIVDVARRNGVDVSSIEDFSAREFVLAKAGKSMDYMSTGKGGVYNKTLGRYEPRDPNAPLDAESLSKNATWLQDDQGGYHIGQLNESGDPRIAKFPENMRVLPPSFTVNTGTEHQIRARPGGQGLGSVPIDVSGEAREKEVGKGKGEATINLPTVRSNSRAMIDMIDNVLNDPYLAKMTGPVQGRLPNVSGSSNRVQSKVDQLQGQAFLQAFNSIRGGGQITEAEGSKATMSLSRLQNMNVNDPEYPQALRDFKAEVIRLATLAEEKASTGQATPTPAPSGALDDARAAISRGAPRDAVIQRLRENGIDPAGL